MSDIAICFSVLAGAVVLFVWNKLPVEVVALGAALTLWATGVLTIEQSIAGFGETTVLFIAALFVVSEGLDATGVTAWAGQQLIEKAGTSQTRLVILTMLLVALLTSLISVNGAVAALVPMVVVLAVRLGRSPSQLLMPVAFAAHAGSMLALTGTPVSVIVSEAASDAGFSEFGFFEFTLVGVPLVIGVIAITVVLGPRLLPNRQAEAIPTDLSELARTIARDYAIDDIEHIHRLEVAEGSRCIGRRAGEIDLGGHDEVTLIGVQRPGALSLELTDVVEAGDVVTLRGARKRLSRVAADLGLVPEADVPASIEQTGLVGRDYGVSELVVPPRSALIGARVFPGMTSSSGDVVVLAVQRKGEDLPAERPTVLATGDVLLVRGTWDALEQQLSDPDLLVVDVPSQVRRQAVPLGRGAKRAIVVLAAMVILLATGAMPPVAAALLAAMALVVTGVLTMQDAYRSISWTTILLVGGMTPLSVAMRETGAADKLADGLVSLVGDAGPYALVAGLFVLTAGLGQLISNMATALIVIPIAVSAAAELDVSARPVLMAVNIAAAAAFLTPVATPANLMVMGPGGYRFGDYWKLGGCMLLWFFVIATALVPLIWSF
ncbi:MAG: SLC13 family permease [Actinobacteria bacterium]|nr:SLC13 family permease [Actinomycetota bacterium]